MRGCVVALLGTLVCAPGLGADRSGEEVYKFYCYQCHGYSGDARTLAATYLDPQPRDFTRTDPDALTRARMLDAIEHGRSGTAMTSFASVLSSTERARVVDYIRARFMGDQPVRERYHSEENGWKDHERYSAAFPFVTGRMTLDTPWEELDDAQREGKRLYLTSCISCHDHGSVSDPGPVWQPRAVSYPRRHYSHVDPDALDGYSGATPFARHDIAPDIDNLTAAEQRGRDLFQDNCAFCHAADGTGRNWIGSFLEPPARDLTGDRVASLTNAELAATIASGLPGASMPAWQAVLDKDQIESVVAYVRRLRGERHSAPERSTAATPQSAPESRLIWRRTPAAQAAEP